MRLLTTIRDSAVETRALRHEGPEHAGCDHQIRIGDHLSGEILVELHQDGAMLTRRISFADLFALVEQREEAVNGELKASAQAFRNAYPGVVTQNDYCATR